ncbi:unnamed protein product [Cercospora beticola]|nr:unnamed protein product [Cercospora beticola]
MASTDENKQATLEAQQLATDIWLITTSEQNREDLFRKAVTALAHSQEEASLILKNLTRIAPELATHFSLRTPAQIYDTPFRIICAGDDGNFPFAPGQPVRQYLAVSYCWRHEDNAWPDDRSTTHSPWPFSKPFVDAILNERGVDSEDGRNVAYRRECIFVDAICIDQTNENEKQGSIAMMDVVYKSCRKLIILLEDVMFSDEEMAIVNCIDHDQIVSGVQGLGHTVKDTDLPLLTRVWRKVEASRWWGRSWCWHEFEVNEPWNDLRCSFYAHCATFVVRNPTRGTFKIKWLQLLFIRAIAAGHTATEEVHSTEELRGDSRWSIADNRISRHGDGHDRRAGSKRSSIMARLYVINDTRSTLTTDLIQIALNLSGLALYYTGKAQLTREEVAFMITTLALSAGEKSPLTLMRDKMLTIDGEESWLSAQVAEFDFSVPSFVLDGITGIHSVTPKAIELDLLFFESPSLSVSSKEVQWTFEIFPENPIATTPPTYRDGLSRSMQVYDDTLWDTPRRTFLAQACNCGLDFIVRLWKQLEREVVHESYNQAMFHRFESNETLRPYAERLVELLASNAKQTGKEHPLFEIVLLFLTWLTDPRSIYYISAFCLRIPCAKDDYALASGIMLRTMEGIEADKLRLAIPTDLIGTSCQMFRVWVLRPKDESDYGEYRIVGKMLLLGEPALVPNEMLRLARRQVVTARSQ